VSALLSAESKDKTTVSELAAPKFLGLAAFLAVLGLLSKELFVRLGPDKQEKAREKLRTDLVSARKEATTGYRRWVEAMARALGASRAPRCVVADIETLDAETKGAIAGYLKASTARRSAPELWLLFESYPESTFHNAFMSDVVEMGNPCPTLLEQEILSEDERVKLAAEVGHPERAAFHTVGAICEPDPSAYIALKRRFDEYRAAHPASKEQYGTLELLYLLSLTAQDVPFSRPYLQQNLRSHDVRSEALLAALPGATLHPSELREHVRGIVNDFSIALDERHATDEGFEILPEAADLLIKNRVSYGLPDPAIGHLFWSLFWYDHLRNQAAVDPFFVRKLLTHIDNTSAPSVLIRQFSPELTTKLGEASLLAAREGIKASILKPVPDTLDFAESLLSESDSRGPRRVLRHLCWTAYTLLGDDRIMRVILQLHPQVTRADPANTVRVMDRFYAELLEGGDPSAQSRINLAKALSEDSALRGYAWVRAYWMATLLLNVPSACPCSPMAVAAATEGAPQLASLISDALSRLQAPTGERLASDVMTVSIGLWTLSTLASRPSPADAFATLTAGQPDESDALAALTKVCAEITQHGALAPDTDAAVSLLADAWVVSEDLQDAARSATLGAGYDFPLRGLVQELRVMIAACATLLQGALRRLTVESRSDLEELMTLVGAHDGRSDQAHGERSDAKEATARQMGLVELAWQHLGFDQLASLMALRRAEFIASGGTGGESTDRLGQVLRTLPAELAPKFAAFALHGSRAHDTFEKTLSSMPEELSETGWRGLAAGCIAAQVLATRSENAAQVFTTGVTLALEGRLGDALGAELDLMAIGVGHSYSS
jgi:hypothetical protein